jgi:Zn-finger nucleic acid-binding protein
MYRDNYAHCPRCKTELITIGTALACANCGGRFVEASELLAFAREMSPAGVEPPSDLVFIGREHAPSEPLACPRCGDPTRSVWASSVIPVNQCERHGVWFDPNEMQQTLIAYAHASFAAQHRSQLELRSSQLELRSSQQEMQGMYLPWISVAIETTIPGRAAQPLQLIEAQQLLKPVLLIGSSADADIRLFHGARHHHAKIWRMKDNPPLLLAMAGENSVLFDGKWVTSLTLRTGDQCTVGSYTLTFTVLS